MERSQRLWQEQINETANVMSAYPESSTIQAIEKERSEPISMHDASAEVLSESDKGLRAIRLLQPQLDKVLLDEDVLLDLHVRSAKFGIACRDQFERPAIILLLLRMLHSQHVETVFCYRAHLQPL